MTTLKHPFSIVMALLIVISIAGVTPCEAQYREYLVYGKVVDNTQAPIPGVTVTLKDKATSRTFKCVTDKKGKFRYAGLPHAVFNVTFSKDGFETKTDKWDLNKSQTRMQKVNYHTILLLSTRQLQEIEVGKKIKKGYTKAKEFMAAKDYDGAIALLEPMIKDKPDEGALLYLLGTCYLSKKEYDKAAPTLEKVMKLSPTFPGGFFQSGVCSQRMGKLDQALEYYKKTLEMDPDNFACLYNCGLILYQKDKVGEALPYFEKALVVNPTDAEIYEMAGLAYLREGDNKKSLDYLTKARANVKSQEKIATLDALIEEVKKTTEAPK